MTCVLITGGAGFIGAHAAATILTAGYEVRILDNLSPQIHGVRRQRPSYLTEDAELIVGDVTDAMVVDRALRGADIVIHLASSVGVGQSMYDIEPYVKNNELGTAILLQAVAKRPVQRLIVASSMSIYGEGACLSSSGEIVAPRERSIDQLRCGEWGLHDVNGQLLEPIPTPETKQPAISSIYALNKYAQERMSLIIGKAYGIPTVALRLFNVYGPYQALSNPYTGVLAIFAARLLNRRPPLVFEDGLQRRDFVHVHDVARAFLLAMETSHIDDVYNVASGESRTILSIAHDLAEVMGCRELTPTITGKYRAGDIRHCFADIEKSRALLGFIPRVAFDDGLKELAHYLADQIADDQAEKATQELLKRGLVA